MTTAKSKTGLIMGENHATYTLGLKERQMEGIALAKKKGLYKGRKTALSQEQIQEVRRLVSVGHPKAQIARDFSISREPLYRHMKNR